MSKNVLVFGGSGFLGGYVVEELEKRNYKVVVADLKPLGSASSATQYIPCDIMDEKAVNAAMNPETDFVFNFAGFANLDHAVNEPKSTTELNVIGNINILNAALRNNIQRFIFASSAYAMSDKGSFYGISKLTSEKIVAEYYKRYGLRYTIVRYGSVYSERNYDNNYIYNLIRQMILEREIKHNGDGNEMREYIHAADAAQLSVDLLESDKYDNDHIILTGVEKMKRRELFEMIKEILGSDIIIDYSEHKSDHHYQLSPYSFQPEVSRKLVANPYIDMGQGILECIKAVKREL